MIQHIYICINEYTAGIGVMVSTHILQVRVEFLKPGADTED